MNTDIKLKTNSKDLKKQKGSLAIPLGVIIVLLIAGIGGYLLLNKNQQIKTPTTQENTTIPSTKTQEPPGLKTFQSKSRGITLKYPENWVTSDDEFISELPFTPGEQDLTKKYNIIEIQKYSEQIYSGYTNRQWFDQINNLKIGESFSDQREQRTKLVSGKVASGESYVIFKDEPSSTFVGSPAHQVKAYIIKQEALYQLTLDLYDEKGLNTFIGIVPTAIINQ